MQDGKIQADLRLQNAGTLKATADCTFSTPDGPLTVKGFKVVDQGTGPWIGIPSKEYTGKDGQRHFQKMVELPRPLMKAVTEAVLSAFHAETAK